MVPFLKIIVDLTERDMYVSNKAVFLFCIYLTLHCGCVKRG